MNIHSEHPPMAAHDHDRKLHICVEDNGKRKDVSKVECSQNGFIILVECSDGSAYAGATFTITRRIRLLLTDEP